MKVLASWIVFAGLWLLPSQSVPPPASAVSRVAVIGASMSAGFGIGSTLPIGAVNMADIVNASITGDHLPPRNLASSLVSLSPAAYMTRTTAALTTDPPSAVVALDYLFWSFHGVKTDAERERQLANALAGLEQFTCPILLGDLPDMTAATLVPAPMITPAMLSSPSMRDAANARIRTWAGTRSNVTVVPLADLLKSLNEGREIRVRGNVWKDSEGSRLMQADRLHPTLDGLVTIWIAAADAWLQSTTAPPATTLDLDATRLTAAVRARIPSAPR